jgi:hypothetical protein
VAFVPAAIAYHHKDVPTRRQLLSRAYWNGVSAGFLEYLLYPQTWLSAVYHAFSNTAAAFIFLIYSLFSLIGFNSAGAIYQLLRATWRIGLMVSELRLVGNWDQIRAWLSANPRSLDRFLKVE